MTDETTTEQLAEIEGQSEQEPQPQAEAEPQPEPQAEPVQVCEGRWRTRGGEVKNIRPCEPLKGAHFVWPWTDGIKTFQDNGRHLAAVSDNDLVEYLGPIEAEPQQVNDWPSVQELRDELKTVQTQLGESRQRVTQLEELVASLRTINAAQEKTVRLAGQANTDLQHRLDVVSAEWAEQLETVRKLQTQLEAVKAEVVQERLERNRWHNQVLRLTAELDNKTTECRNLRIELDALQQAPQAETMAATPPATEDRFEQGWDAGTARAVETVLEWLEPIRHLIDAADNMAETEQASNLAADIIRALPAIMRSLTGLADED